MRNLELLVPQPGPDKDSWRWATVVQVGPLRVQFDGETAPLPITPESLAGDLAVGMRVWCQIHGKRVIVHGIGGLGNTVSIRTTPFTASGTYTKPIGLVGIIVEVQSGGGAGGASAPCTASQVCAGQGGGAGGYAKAFIPASVLGATTTVTVGGGGKSSGASGEASSFGTHVITEAGTGGGTRGPSTGLWGGNTNRGLGGSTPTFGAGVVEIMRVAGQHGFGSLGQAGANVVFGGQGGSSAMGAGGAPGVMGASGNNGFGWGAGGGGGATPNSGGSANSGGDGSNGIVLITEFLVG